MKLPDKVFGISTKEAYKKYLERAENPEKKKQQSPVQVKGVDEGEYIFMPSRNLYIAKERSHLDKNWYDAHKALHQERARMLTLKEFIDFLNLLKNGDGDFKRIYNDITEVRSPLRGEWLDADFKMINNQLHMNYNHRTVNGELKPQNSEPLTDYLTSNKTPGISLEDWLSNPTPQGLPPSNNSDGNLYYWHPRDGRVAGFGADSGRAGLVCGRNPRDSDASLGVRAAKIR